MSNCSYSGIKTFLCSSNYLSLTAERRPYFVRMLWHTTRTNGKRRIFGVHRLASVLNLPERYTFSPFDDSGWLFSYRKCSYRTPRRFVSWWFIRSLDWTYRMCQYILSLFLKSCYGSESHYIDLYVWYLLVAFRKYIIFMWYLVYIFYFSNLELTCLDVNVYYLQSYVQHNVPKNLLTLKSSLHVSANMAIIRC
jgi:hypothetical protein